MQRCQPIQIAVFQAVDQHLSRGNVGGNRNVVHIALAQQKLIVGFAGLGVYGITEEEQQIHFTAGHLGGNLFCAAARAGIQTGDI